MNKKRLLVVLSAASLAFALLSTAPTLRAQTPDKPTDATEAQQLKDRLRQLEQTVQELQGKINALENAQTKSEPAIVQATYETSATPSATETTAKPQESGEKKGESTFQVYGYVMLDSGYQFKANNPDWFDVVRSTKLPAFEGRVCS